MKVTVIGAGNVGAKAVYYIAEKNIADIVMVDVVDGLAQSKAWTSCTPRRFAATRWASAGQRTSLRSKGSDVVVITAGIARKPGMDRMDLLRTNVGIARQAAREIARRAPNAVVIVVTNPLDVIAMVVLRETGFALSQGDRHGGRAGFHEVSLVHRRDASGCGRGTCRPWCWAVTGTTWFPSRASPRWAASPLPSSWTRPP